MTAAKLNWFEKQVALAGAYSYKAMKKMPGMDGLAWCGDLCFNGKKIGFVRDAGHGGMLEVEIAPAFKEQVKKDSIAYYAAEHNDVVEEDAFKYMAAEEFFLPWLADWQDNLKSIKAKCKNRVVVITESEVDSEGAYRMYPTGSVAKLAAIKAKYPTHFYLNDQF